MKGYRKISQGTVHCPTWLRKSNDNYALDEDIRSVVHSPIIGENEKTECEEFLIVIYKWVKK